MEDKYSIENVYSAATAFFFLQEESKNKQSIFFGGEVPIHEYRIFIKLKSDLKNCFLIASEKNGPTALFFGICAGSVWRLQQKGTELYEHRDDLGEITIQRNGLTIKIYPDYDRFWDEIKRI